MTASASFHYAAHTVRFSLLDECSVSAHIAQTQSFYELPFLERLGQMLPPDTQVVDVGAHLGNHTVFFAQVLGLRVLAFEPSPETFAALVENVELAGVQDLVTCVNAAVSDTTGVVSLHRGVGADKGTFSIVPVGGHEGVSVDVNCVELDDVLGDWAIASNPIFVKIDVEGHEPAVLRGAQGLLANEDVVGISVECSVPEEYDECQPLLSESFVPVDIMNPTPTVIFARRSGAIDTGGGLDQAVRYGIRYAEIANRTAVVSAGQVARATTSARSVVRLERVEETFRAILEQSRLDPQALSGTAWRSFATGAKKQLTTVALRHLIVLDIDETAWSAPLLSTHVERVDSIQIRQASEVWTLTRRSFAAGQEIAASEMQFPVLDLEVMAMSLRRAMADVDLTGQGIVCVAGNAGRRPEEMLALVSVLECPYVVTNLSADYNGAILRLENGALHCAVPTAAVAEAWAAKHVVPAAVVPNRNAEVLISWLDELLSSKQESVRESSVTSQAHRVLIVSYFAAPTTPVSTKRLGYWFDELDGALGALGADSETVWLSASGCTQGSRHRIVRDRGDLLVGAAASARLAEMNEVGAATIGVSWADNVRREVRSWTERFDTVIISCGPFGYIDLATFFRDTWDCNVIIDFRDPYGGDARMAHTIHRRAWIFGDEHAAIESADAVMSVNQQCLDVIGPGVEVRRIVMPNGFDEREAAFTPPTAEGLAAPSESIHRLLYVGTIFANLPVDTIVDALDPSTFQFLHCGRDQSVASPISAHPAVESRGFISDSVELGRLLATADAGVLRTSGEPTTQTTKVFDYLGANLDVIIVTDGQPRTGALHDLTADIAGVHWVRNDPAELSAFFASYRPERHVRAERMRFSRQHQTQQLAEVIVDLGRTDRTTHS